MGTDNGLPLYTEVEMHQDVRPRGKFKSHDPGSTQPNRLAMFVLGMVVILALFANLWILLSIREGSGCPECAHGITDDPVIFGGNGTAAAGKRKGPRPVAGIVVVPDEKVFGFACQIFITFFLFCLFWFLLPLDAASLLEP